MARKVIDVPITDETSRDKGRVYRITEKDVYSAEFWAMRAFGGMLESGVTIPNLADVSGASLELLFHFGIGSLMKVETELLKELIDELMECVQIVPLPDREPGVARRLLPGDIEELSTLVKLRLEVLKLHTGFFPSGAIQNIG